MSKRLGAADRRLFVLVSQAAYENPFGARRGALDSEISESPAGDPAWTGRMLQRVGARLAALGPRLRVHDFAPADRQLVEDTLLFEAFHRVLAPLDAFIAAQERAADAPLRIDFARWFLSGLGERGIEPARALRMLELFYQMRRAFIFISRGLVGGSACMRLLREALWLAVFTHDIRRYERHLWNRMEDFSTILIGETGTGKGAAAAAIGLSGFIAFDPKKEAFAHNVHEAFLPIHLNEFPESLFESEIFGHRKGAFTGAVDNYEGVLARCRPHGGVFFDEIGEVTLPVQVKLLRVLQDRVYTPVGSREQRRFSGRILAATHRSLPELRAAGALRDDFFYRLCSNSIEVPPLRTRLAQARSELAELVSHLCTRITGNRNEELAAEVVTSIERDLGTNYAFPGNVRELEQCVRRVLLTGSCVRDDKPTSSDDRALARALEQGTWSAEQLLERYCTALYGRSGSYVEVARITGLDRRTVKKHVERTPSTK
ncbi:MAG TPA: sigma 54-interacting transcriptional regulator [Polyangiales bacterium]|nr:sigma 54-interacting transcriptional regulator [Polyangiales bacterium]